jgi:hypothetical protein
MEYPKGVVGNPGQQRRSDRKAAAKTFQGLLKAKAWGIWQKASAVELERRRMELLQGCIAFFWNDLYSVQIFPRETNWGEVTQLLIRRHDGKPNIPWAHKQRIKTELVGPERTAVEVFPSELDLVDQAHCYHLWVLPEGMDLPFGLAH